MITAVLALAFIVVLVLGHEFGHFLAAKLSGMRVDEFGFGFPPRLFSKKKGETVYSFNLLPFGGFVKIYGEEGVPSSAAQKDRERSYYFQPAYKKAIVLLAGVIMNLLIGWAALVAVFSVGIPQNIVVTGVISNSPAALAGIKAGDQILGFSQTSDLINYVSRNDNGNVSLKIMTNDAEKTISLKPQNGRIGVYISQGGIPKEGFWQSMKNASVGALNMFGFIFESVYKIFAGLFAGHYGVVNEVTGPVGIYNILSFSSTLGAGYVLELLALISINLAAINVIPFPALDGGRLLFLALGKIFRKGLEKVEAVANAVGFALLVALMFAITFKDVINLH
ncbi:MAG: site-2 protease family protein [Patescibacteria group bacterium]|nr:site-2 protease family protein [Patescibacteria group bacterium]